jgi:hypothetical protein
VDQRLFSDEELTPWMSEWQNMPSYVVEDLSPKFQIIVSFACEADVEDFAVLIGQRVSPGTRQLQSVWFPEQEIGRYANKRYIGDL